jgi:phosphatidate cytidylyltransferase
VSTATPSPAAKRSDLGVRSVTGIALALTALACVIYGQTPYWLLLSVAALIMFAEWASMLRAERWRMWAGFVALTLALLVEQPHLDAPDGMALAVLVVAMALFWAIVRDARLAAGLLYAGLPTVALFYLHEQYDGIDLTLWTLSIVWATDIGAYFAGRRFGGAKLAPAISPAKTWSGLIGGIVAASAIGLLLAHWLRLPVRLAGFAGLLAIAAQAGDLYESAMKRRAGIKDSGRILPGHGGAMDRLDGVVPVACLVALIVAVGVV